MTGSGAGLLVALLVEDNPADAELIALRLTNGTSPEEVRLVNAASAAAACVELRRTAVDVVILDLTLPDARWLEALNRVREVAPEVPVVVLTGMTDESLALEALRAGAQDYVLKPPPHRPSLQRILRYACERQNLLRRLDVAGRASELHALQWRLLAEAGTLLASADTVGPAIAKVAKLLVPAAAECCIVVVGTDDAVTRQIEVAHRDERREIQLGVELANDRSELRRALVGLVHLLESTGPVRTGEENSGLASIAEWLGLDRGIAVPLYHGGRVLGLITLFAAPGRATAVADMEFARSLADRICLATETASLLEQTRSAVAARDRAFGIVSHDLRNPLNTIQICATALLDPEPPPANGIRDMAQIIQRSASWMNRIVLDLLDGASLDAGRLALERRPTAVSDVVGAAQIIYAPIADEEEVELRVQSAPDLPSIDADPHRLLQVLSNLLSNAVKFTAPGGHVVLSTRAASPDESTGAGLGGVRFEVTDDGPGIAPDERAHVSEWFWQAPGGARRGTGLGLAIARGLIEAHGSRLRIDSEPGVGSTFWFVIGESADA
jgi:signal transduction histidine kinase